MAISMVVVLGLAFAFYAYVATRWWREVMQIRREGSRSSRAMVLVFASAPEDNIVAMRSRDRQEYGSGADTREAELQRRYAIVMGRRKAGKHQRRVVA
jgi:hypothetical protein